MFLFGSNAHSNLRAVVSIGSHTMRGLVFQPGEKNALPRMLKKIVFRVPYSTQDEALVVRKLGELILTMTKSFGRVPVNILVGLGSHCGSHTLTTLSGTVGTDIHKPSSEKDLKILFQDLCQKNNVSSSFAGFPLEFFSNGYSLTSCVASRRSRESTCFDGARVVSVQTLAVDFPQNISTMLFDTKKSLGGIPIEFLPLEIVYKEVLEDVLKTRDVLLVEIDGEETFIGMLLSNQLVHFTAFPLGIRHFIRGIARGSMSFEEAEIDLRHYVEGLMPQNRSEALRGFLDVEVSNWKKMFQQAIDGFYSFGPIPEEVVLSGEGAMIKEIEKVLRVPDWMKNISAYDVPKVKTIMGRTIFDGNSLNGFIHGPEDFSLASLIHYSLQHI